MSNVVINLQNVSKNYGRLRALQNINLTVTRGQIVGLIGLNGAGKTTLLKTLLGFTGCRGEVDVLGLHPRHKRKQLMSRVGYIADVAILPRWLKVSQAIDFVEGVHPDFNREKALKFLNQTDIQLKKKIKTLSKGMMVQLHLALIMAIDNDLLVLDEPTLGLDILHRKEFYHNLLNHYFNENHSILISTHQVEEIEHLLTQIVMLNKGIIILNCSISEFKQRFVQVIAPADKTIELSRLQPILTVKQLDKVKCVFENTDIAKLKELGELSTPSISDVFVAKVGGEKP
jgi:ABC-2 type transport system ATP-binding protein